MQHARKMFLKQAVLLVAVASVCVFAACGKNVTTNPPPPPTGLMAGSCSDTWANSCDSTNTCSSGTCAVNLAATAGGGATAKLAGQNPQSPKDKFVCVAQGASLQWQAPNGAMGSPNQFVGDFGGLSPWQSQKNYIVGGGNTSDTETPAALATKCYKYNLYVCNSALAPSLTVSCGVDDPKVIVGN